ncbi:TetR/AcrR family transcriptional regulator [Alteribacillus sp. YIM 98480]|uniref:TetR/AcrR family transcriptional regulator n=1 Tax=Alteribacillus sp. YIM 98480 TaxID=2606599 RepID=UPI001E5D6B25|nr:TetR/AcrR family transcriptional regulator [Alteribacillus sp. YIM 98480]
MVNSRQQQAIETKNRLLKAAELVFLEHGFQNTTIRLINNKAETGHGTAYVYFKNKEDFLIKIMEDTMEQFKKIASIPFYPATVNEAYELVSNQVKLFLSLAIKKKELMKVIKEAIGVSKEVEGRWQDIRDQFTANITKDIMYAQEHELADSSLSPPLVARLWFYTNEMFMWEVIDEKSSNDIEEIIKHMTTIYMKGLYSNPNQ